MKLSQPLSMPCNRLAFARWSLSPTSWRRGNLSGFVPRVTGRGGAMAGRCSTSTECPQAFFAITGWAFDRSGARGAIPARCHQPSGAQPSHGYLTAKGLAPFGIRQSGEALLVPMLDPAFGLWNLQRIAPDGGKRFLPGGRIDGLFWCHAMHLADGRPSPGPLVIGEGFATVAAIHEATGYAVAAAMSARNLGPVAKAMRGLFPARQIIIAADDDCHLAENMGLGLARSAAESIGGLLATPRPETSRGDSGADFADLTRAEAAAIIAATLQGEA